MLGTRGYIRKHNHHLPCPGGHPDGRHHGHGSRYGRWYNIRAHHRCRKSAHFRLPQVANPQEILRSKNISFNTSSAMAMRVIYPSFVFILLSILPGSIQLNHDGWVHQILGIQWDHLHMRRGWRSFYQQSYGNFKGEFSTLPLLVMVRVRCVRACGASADVVKFTVTVWD